MRVGLTGAKVQHAVAARDEVVDLGLGLHFPDIKLRVLHLAPPRRQRVGGRRRGFMEFWTERGQCDGQWTDGGDGLQGQEPIFVSREK